MPSARLLVALAALASSAAAQASRPADYERRADAPAGKVTVRVRYRGEAPTSRPIVLAEGYRRRAPEDAAFCDGCAKEGKFFDESLLVDPVGKGVRNVAVAFKKAPVGRRAPLAPLVLDNSGALFRPRVAFAPVGEAIAVKNSDPLVHALALSSLDEGLLCNVVVQPKTTTATPKLLAPGIYVATCPLHDWMRATVIAVRHPYAEVTAADGRAVFADAPPGKADLVLFHETLGTAVKKIEVVADGETAIEVTDADFRALR
jgi:hypothetical protein